MDEAHELVLEMARALSNAASALALASIRATSEECHTYLLHLVEPVEQLSHAMERANNDVEGKKG